MGNTVIKVENLSKLYRLGQVGTGTLRHDFQRWWARVRGREDPFAKIGQVNDRTQRAQSDYVWALKDLNFEVKRGEVLGIVGANGAGKSTLLKILSKITSPTKGCAKTQGRVASLLEVGTGFHPEMTGRENIFLNGAILGMRRWEIQQKFDAIVDFAGVEAYVDTPVKRYSSGMYVRLAFAVAAFLEPEILIVDEVLAVGDAEFQKKCLGRMKDISGEGRTVLFVSHNMAAAENLCTQGLLLQNGNLFFAGSIQKVIDNYISDQINSKPLIRIDSLYGPCDVEISTANNFPSTQFKMGEIMRIKFKFGFHKEVTGANIGIGINTLQGIRVVTYHTYYELNESIKFRDGLEICCEVPHISIMHGFYNMEISLFEDYTHTFFNKRNLFTIEILNVDYYDSGRLPNPRYQGFLIQKSKWTTNQNYGKKN